MDIKVDFTDLVIKTDRLVLRAFRDSDLEDFLNTQKYLDLVKWLVGLIMKI